MDSPSLLGSRTVSRMSVKRGVGIVIGAALALSCYSTDNGTEPPRDRMNYPVGLAVSAAGRVLYVANSDFDLAYTAGTLQALDLTTIRRHAALAVLNPANPELPRIRPANGTCPYAPNALRPDGTRQALGESCAPPVDARAYIRNSVLIGAFATDLQISSCEATPTNRAEKYGPETTCSASGKRLYVPVRGDTTVTWVDVPFDTGIGAADFTLNCGTDGRGRCDTGHRAGRGDEPGNTRQLALPNEPFGMAQSQDGTHFVVTHQVDGKASLFSTGFSPVQAFGPPSLQWVLENVTPGGNGIAAIPHDRALACTSDEPCENPPPRSAFLQTSRNVPGIDLFRFNPDETSVASSLKRPFLSREATYGVNGNAGGTDSRGIVIDRSPRIRCKANVRNTLAATDPTFASRMQQCGRIPARVFVANRSPASIVYGETGSGVGADFNPDRLILGGSIPLSTGPTRVYLAPIVDARGAYALRLFAVCFDAQIVYIIDPDSLRLENVLRLAPGPFAMAFDPFSFEDAATGAMVKTEPGEARLAYRFAYIASFTDSFIHVVDLDNSSTNKESFERPVLSVGDPTPPKGN